MYFNKHFSALLFRIQLHILSCKNYHILRSKASKKSQNIYTYYDDDLWTLWTLTSSSRVRLSALSNSRYLFPIPILQIIENFRYLSWQRLLMRLVVVYYTVYVLVYFVLLQLNKLVVIFLKNCNWMFLFAKITYNLIELTNNYSKHFNLDLLKAKVSNCLFILINMNVKYLAIKRSVTVCHGCICAKLNLFVLSSECIVFTRIQSRRHYQGVSLV